MGLMVRVCKLALKQGFKPYAPTSLKLLPPLPVVHVEPGRLDIRCLEFMKKARGRGAGQGVRSGDGTSSRVGTLWSYPPPAHSSLVLRGAVGMRTLPFRGPVSTNGLPSCAPQAGTHARAAPSPPVLPLCVCCCFLCGSVFSFSTPPSPPTPSLGPCITGLRLLLRTLRPRMLTTTNPSPPPPTRTHNRTLSRTRFPACFGRSSALLGCCLARTAGRHRAEVFGQGREEAAAGKPSRPGPGSRSRSRS